jgi:hypothetical protein
MRKRNILFKTGLTALLIFWAGMPGNEELRSLLLSLISPGNAWAQTSCGEKILSLGLYEDISMYSLISGFVLVFSAIFMEKKKVKLSLSAIAILPFLIWGYVNFLVDYDKIRKTIFNYNVQAEATLANIAEAQERYQSEQGNFITDLKVLESHLAGAHGMDECVKVIELNASFGHWSAVAQHRSSPDTVRWDSTSGSSLKKG